MKHTLIALICTLALGCAHTPPNLTPEATNAFHASRVVAALDILRDAAIDGSGQPAPLVSINTARAIVLYHKSALKIIQATQSGWKPALIAGLDETMAHISTADQQALGPYVAMVRTILQEMP